MAARGEAPGERLGRLGVWIRLILSGIPGVSDGLAGAAAWPPDWDELGYADYLYRERALLVRDADVDRVRGIVSSVPVHHDNSLSGLTRLDFADDESRSVEEVCAAVARELGREVATPDHVLYICIAAEPEEVPADAQPYPAVSAGLGDGDGVLVTIVDSGLLPGAAAEHRWLAGVAGEQDNPVGGHPPRVLPYAGHGAFVAGVLRTVAPGADVWVSRAFKNMRGAYESDVVAGVLDAVKMGAGVILLPFGAFSRKDNPLLGFEVLEELLRSYPRIALVAAAGDHASRRPFWPAAFPWILSVGALGANGRSSASFSNYGTSVDVFAPGEGLVNVYATGQYIRTIPPYVGQVQVFDGMARWSGTSFSAPLVAGLVAARMSKTGETGRAAAGSLLQSPQTLAMPGVGLILSASVPEFKATAGKTVFVSYAHEDDSYREQLDISLAPLRRDKLIIATWNDREILAGEEWEREIDEKLNSADIILLLVSRYFFASDYISEHELPLALERHKSGSAVVVPILLRVSDWESSLGELQAVPGGGKPVLRWRDRDEAWLNIARNLRRLIEGQG
jgi:subtilisin family serine protease